jgi:DNA invertase Pin-like site-specific DNA recombinase
MTGPFTPAQLARARALRNAGLSWDGLAAEMGTTVERIRYAIDAAFAERRRVGEKKPRADDGTRQAPAVPAPAARIIELAEIGTKHTAIAALTRTPYRVVSEVLERHRAREGA